MEIYLSLGANIGNREQAIESALLLIAERVGPITARSGNYYNPAVGFETENEFLNICIAVRTPLSPIQVLIETEAIERELGRQQKSVNGIYHDRVIDIDLLCATEDGQDIVVDTPKLKLPHPRMQEREFVMVPLREIQDPSQPRS